MLNRRDLLMSFVGSPLLSLIPKPKINKEKCLVIHSIAQYKLIRKLGYLYYLNENLMDVCHEVDLKILYRCIDSCLTSFKIRDIRHKLKEINIYPDYTVLYVFENRTEMYYRLIWFATRSYVK